MSRIDRIARWARWAAAAIALLLGGCMRIYQDAELPDLVVAWQSDFECADASERVVVSLSTVDPFAEVDRVVAPCRDSGVRFDDLSRARYRLTSHLEDAAGTALGGNDTEVDLRDGTGERIGVFFAVTRFGSEFRIAWTFDMGASCAALSATFVILQATVVTEGIGTVTESRVAPCSAPALRGALPIAGTYTFTAFAFAGDTMVAAAPMSAPVAVSGEDDGAVRDVGTLTLSPCGADCPGIVRLRP